MKSLIKSWIKKIAIPRQEVIFDNFNESVNVIIELASILRSSIGGESLNILPEDIEKLKRKRRGINKKILLYLDRTLITPLDREDLQQVNFLLNTISKQITKIILMLMTYQPVKHTSFLQNQIEILLNTTKLLIHIVYALKTIKKTKIISENNERVKSFEVKGDIVLFKAMTDLFSGDYDAFTAIKLKDIYNGVEKIIDSCCTLSETVLNLSLKYT